MKRRLPLLLLVGAFLLLILVEWSRPRPLDWRPSFEADAAQPYGGRVLYDLLPELLGGAEVVPVRRPPYLHLDDSTRTGTTYFFLTSYFAPDDDEALRLLRYVERGNTVFLATEEVGGLLGDTLGLETDWYYGDLDDLVRADSVLYLANPSLGRPGGFWFDDDLAYTHFVAVDTARTTVLGTARDTLVNYVRVDVGAGAFYLSTVPISLTNYGLLGGDGAAYAAAALSYLPTQPTYWDAYVKPLRNAGATPLRFVLEQPALRWAYFLALVGVLLFIVFRGRRWQRAVPVVAPPPNHTRRFAETVGRLYHQHGDDRDLVEKQARFFLDRLRTDLAEPGLDFSDEARERVARKASVPRDDVDTLFDLFVRLRAAASVSAHDLLELDRRTDAFMQRMA